jgi:hypothetical protein
LTSADGEAYTGLSRDARLWRRNLPLLLFGPFCPLWR